MTCSRICRRFAKASSLLVRSRFGATRVLAQSLDPSALLKPTADSWPTYHGDYIGTAPQQADADHAGERQSAHARVGVSDRISRSRSRRRRSS